MNSFESGYSSEDLSLEERAHRFALDQVGELDTATNEKQYWDNYYYAYYQYIDSERILDGYNEEEDEEEYEFFRYEEARNEVFSFSKSIAEYLREHNIKDLIIVDRSSRPLYIGVMEYWKRAFPDSPMPSIYFINPKGFKSADILTSGELLNVNDDAYYKGDLDEEIYKARSQSDIMKEFQEVYPKLIKDKDKPILVFDTCIHSGDTLSPVTETLNKLGFTKIKIGSVNPSDKSSKVQTDFWITKKGPEKGCYPFDQDRMIEKTFEHVYSKPSTNSDKRDRGVMLRKEIKRIMEEYI